MGRNYYSVKGGTAYLHIANSEDIVISFDVEDLPLVSKHTWYVEILHGGYARVKSNYYPHTGSRKKVCLYLHRLIIGAPADKLVDHVDRNPLNNRRTNLRLATPAENCQNLSEHTKKNNTSGIRGVSYGKWANKWEAYLTIEGKKYRIGYFDTVNEAEAAVKKYRAKYMPFSIEALAREE